MTEVLFICPPDSNRGRDFDRKECRRHCPCEVDLVGAFVVGYQVEVWRNRGPHWRLMPTFFNAKNNNPNIN